ncbi:hypothetical protein HPB48_005312 [Haemaphysalis longicornis]|uniref:Uncharacterized protein n=1 Tax=Haemaphysalis longicornis TaxID=44386 RepID=A0A9J6GFR2_HAELO|nr:hypothetical protein HPB48_005312 [Haemaphysalis longicornis]
MAQVGSVTPPLQTNLHRFLRCRPRRGMRPEEQSFARRFRLQRFNWEGGAAASLYLICAVTAPGHLMGNRLYGCSPESSGLSSYGGRSKLDTWKAAKPLVPPFSYLEISFALFARSPLRKRRALITMRPRGDWQMAARNSATHHPHAESVRFFPVSFLLFSSLAARAQGGPLGRWAFGDHTASLAVVSGDCPTEWDQRRYRTE